MPSDNCGPTRCDFCDRERDDLTNMTDSVNEVFMAVCDECLAIDEETANAA